MGCVAVAPLGRRWLSPSILLQHTVGCSGHRNEGYQEPSVPFLGLCCRLGCFLVTLLSGAGSVSGLSTLTLILAISGGFQVLPNSSIAMMPQGPQEGDFPVSTCLAQSPEPLGWPQSWCDGD